MSFINYSSREINCKIVYYGPGLCGKTTNLQHVYGKTNPEAKGKMISLATESERTLFFDFLPLSLGEIRGFKTRFHLYTVPGQVFYDASRKLILKGVDGVVFVADSQVERMEANIESLENLDDNLKEQGYDAVLINPPGHLAVGILGGEGYSGSYYNYGGQQYYYCETTAEGYTMGQIPSDYQGQSATIIQVD